MRLWTNESSDFEPRNQLQTQRMVGIKNQKQDPYSPPSYAIATSETPSGPVIVYAGSSQYEGSFGGPALPPPLPQLEHLPAGQTSAKKVSFAICGATHLRFYGKVGVFGPSHGSSFLTEYRQGGA